MAGVLIRTSWGFLLEEPPRIEVYRMVSYTRLGRFFKGARKARKHLRRAEGYYR